jgi:glucose-1-phosphate thymidylyltransferase
VAIDPTSAHRREVIGLIPAAGQATRLAPLPCSKEIYPIGFLLDGIGAQRPKAACQYLLEKMRAADIAKLYIVLREGKWDIPAYFRGGTMLGMHLGYLIVEPNSGPPYTLDEAYPFVRDAIIAFGFPDILFEGDHAFRQLLSHQAHCSADIVLGLFPADRPEEMDMVELGENGRVRDLIIRPTQTGLRYSWDVAVWTPTFTEFLHQYVARNKASTVLSPELSVGEVIQAAIRQNLRVDGLQVSEEPYLDIGTPHGLAEALRRYGRSG